MGSTMDGLEQDVRAAAGGDVDAFGRLVRRYASTVRSIGLAITRDPELSADVAQEVFFGAWEGLHKLRTPAAFGAWLRQITRSKCQDRLRSLGRARGRAVAAARLAEQVADPPRDPEGNLLADEERRILDEALAELSADDREVLILYYREDRSAPQVADLLELEPATVRKRLSRARSRLREGLEERLAIVLLGLVSVPAMVAEAQAAAVVPRPPAIRPGFRLWGAAALTLVVGAVALVVARRPVDLDINADQIVELSEAHRAIGATPATRTSGPPAHPVFLDVRPGDPRGGAARGIYLAPPYVGDELPDWSDPALPRGDTLRGLTDIGTGPPAAPTLAALLDAAEREGFVGEASDDPARLLVQIGVAHHEDAAARVAHLSSFLEEGETLDNPETLFAVVDRASGASKPVYRKPGLEDAFVALAPDHAFAWRERLDQTLRQWARKDPQAHVERIEAIFAETENPAVLEPAGEMLPLHRAFGDAELAAGTLERLWSIQKPRPPSRAVYLMASYGTDRALADGDVRFAARWFERMADALDVVCPTVGGRDPSVAPGIDCALEREVAVELEGRLVALGEVVPTTWAAALAGAVWRCRLDGAVASGALAGTARFQVGWVFEAWTGDDDELMTCVEERASRLVEPEPPPGARLTLTIGVPRPEKPEFVRPLRMDE